MAPRYRVTLTKEEPKELEAISTKGKKATRTVLYARALLLLDAGEHGQKWIAAFRRSRDSIFNFCSSFLDQVFEVLELSPGLLPFFPEIGLRW